MGTQENYLYRPDYDARGTSEFAKFDSGLVAVDNELVAGNAHREATTNVHGLTFSEAGKLDHGVSLGGLTDDDHTQYILANGTRAFTAPITAATTVYGGSGTGNNLVLHSNPQKDGTVGLGDNVFYLQGSATLNTSIASIGGSVVTLVISTAQTLTANLTVPANVSLRIEKGGSIVKASTYTLTINGPFEAGLYKVFDGFSAGDVSFGTRVREIYPQWFGAVGDGATSDTAAFAQAVASINGTQGGCLRISAGDYNANVVINSKDYIHVLGDGARSRLLPASGVGLSITNANWLLVEGLGINCAGIGLEIHGSAQSIFQSLFIGSTADHGVYIDGDDNMEITLRDILAYSGINKVGFYFKTSLAGDTNGGIYLYNTKTYPGADPTGKIGYKFESTNGSPTIIYAFLSDTVADGFTEHSYSFVNVTTVNALGIWGTIAASGKGVVHMDDSLAISFAAPTLTVSNSGGYVFELHGTSYGINITDLTSYGPDGPTIFYFDSGFNGNRVHVWNPNLIYGSYTFTNNTTHLSNSPVIAGSGIWPAVDDAFYLGKNSTSQPFAWKGVILKDTTNSNYYRIEVTNGTLTASQVT